MRIRVVLLVVALMVAGCSSSGSPDTTKTSHRSTTSNTALSSTTTTPPTTAPTTTTTAFVGGSVKPQSTEPTGDRTALLTGVEVAHAPGIDRVTLRFQGTTVPGVRAEYVTDPRADGSGAPVAISGAAHLQLRLEPSASNDLSGEVARPTYTGPARVSESTTTNLTEVVRTGDFEGVLTWVAGLRSKAPFRMSTPGNAGTLVIEVAAP